MDPEGIDWSIVEGLLTDGWGEQTIKDSGELTAGDVLWAADADRFLWDELESIEQDRLRGLMQTFADAHNCMLTWDDEECTICA